MPSADLAFYDSCSKRFGIRFSGCENRDLLRAIDQWLGAPYLLGGCTKQGVDCSCFVQLIYAGVYGISLKRRSKDMFAQILPIAACDLREGDLLFLKPGREISHVGIYITQGKFAHVSSTRGVIISSMHDPYYRGHFFAGGRVPAVQQGLSSR